MTKLNSLPFQLHVKFLHFLSYHFLSFPISAVTRKTGMYISQSCPWVGFDPWVGLGWIGSGRDFSDFSGLSWVHTADCTL